MAATFRTLHEAGASRATATIARRRKIIPEADIEYQINEILRENKLHRFVCETQTNDPERREQAIAIIKTLQKTDARVMEENTMKEQHETETQMDDAKSRAELAMFAKKWTRLTMTQKLDRIAHYLQARQIRDIDRELVRYQQLIESDVLKGKHVEYDIDGARIISIAM